MTTKRTAAKRGPGNPTPLDHAPTWDTLADALGISRRCLLKVRVRYSNAPDLPRVKPDGRHPISQWKEFFAANGINPRQLEAEQADDPASPAAWKARQTEQQVIKLQLANELTRRQQIALSEVQAKLPPFLMAIRTGMDQCIPELATSLEGIDDYAEREEIIQEQFNKVFSMLTACPWLDEKPMEMEDTQHTKTP